MSKGGNQMKKKIVWAVMLMILLQSIPLSQVVFATVQEHPKNISVREINGNPSIGYDASPQTRGHYVNVDWEPVVFDGISRHYNVFYKKNGETFQKYGPSLSEGTTQTRLTQLDSGTVYHVYANAGHIHPDNDPDYPGQTHTSLRQPDDEVMFLTGVDLNVYPAGIEEIEIVWDDVRYNNQHIGYRIYISQSRDFATTSPIEVSPQDIGPSAAVKPTGNNKLSYVSRNRRPGTVYYVKIEPVVYDSRVVVAPQAKISIGYTYIPATMTRVSAGANYDIWKMEWQRVTSSVSGTEETEYIIMQQEQGDLWRSIGGQKDVIRYIKVYNGEEEKFKYRVRVWLQDEYDEYGNRLYIESDELGAYLSQVPYAPAVPDFRYSIPENNDVQMEIGHDRIKMLWYAPKDAEGTRDESIYYDFWITTDPTELYNPQIPPTITDFQPQQQHYVYEKIGETSTQNVVAYQYEFEGLSHNTVYYIKAVAKKRFIINIDGQIQHAYYYSDPAVEMVLTDSGDISVPVSPSKPPFRVKEDLQGNLYVDKTSATVEWRTGWMEIKDEQTGEWVYSEAYDQSVQNNVYREIQYDTDVQFAIGYMLFEEDMTDYSEIREKPLQIMGIENPYGDSHELMEYTIEDLMPNKMYIIWLRAYRNIDEMSEPSDPVIITTDVDYTVPLEKPAVPRWTRAVARDNNEGIELAWDRTAERYGLTYTYYLKWSTQDNIQTAGGEVEIPASYFDTTNVYLVRNLEADTPYYFWIRAEVSNDRDEVKTSDWSDSRLVKTTVYIAPDSPTGFGIKNAADAIGKDYITYEWNQSTQEVSYMIEIATNSEYEGARRIDIRDDWEYRVGGLSSNVRYYARLYAVHKETGLISYPTHTVSVRTLRSEDDYDTDTDRETVITGPIIEDGYNRRTGEWYKEIIGINADRFLEDMYTDRYLDYVIDMRIPHSSFGRISSRRISVAYKVFAGLSQAKENLIIDIGEGARFVIRPDVLDVPEISKYFSNAEEVVVDLIFTDVTSTTFFNVANTTALRMTQVEVVLKAGNTSIALQTLQRPLTITKTYSSFYTEFGVEIQPLTTKQLGFISRWTTLEGDYRFRVGEQDALVTFESNTTGGIGIAATNSQWRFNDVSSHWAASDIRLIFSKYDIKSIGSQQKSFYPERAITVEDCVKIVFDVLAVDYSENTYMDTALKAGLLQLVPHQEYISRQEAISMLVRLYEIKMGEKVEDVNIPIVQFEDAERISSRYRTALEFAAYKGIIIGKSDTMLEPSENVTRAEVIAMLRRTLEAIGEI